ncbi:MAG TPA: flavin reductase, partial [Candidatus Limnocylindria bacterium]|nr:flavin reductase [Candidatus Limnocylindria bacterium]
MKREYGEIPPSMRGRETYGFSWMDFVTAIPSPLFLVTTYKDNGLPNACLQSWSCFLGEDGGFYALLAGVNKGGHLYRTLRETGCAVLNFPSLDIYDRCLATVRHNGWDEDEIAAAGLTAEPARAVNAPRVAECFLHVECALAWERDLAPGSAHAVVC